VGWLARLNNCYDVIITMSAGSGELSREEKLVEAPQPENAASKEFEDVQRYGRVTNTESRQMINVRNHFFIL